MRRKAETYIYGVGIFFAFLGLLAFEMYSILVLGFCSWGLKLWVFFFFLFCENRFVFCGR